MLKCVRGVFVVCVVASSVGCLVEESQQRETFDPTPTQGGLDMSPGRDMADMDPMTEEMTIDMVVEEMGEDPCRLMGLQDNDGDGRCEPSCKADTCGPPENMCEDASGRIMCDCAPGYAGARCAMCSDDHERDNQGRCVRRLMPTCDPACMPGESCVLGADGRTAMCVREGCPAGTQDEDMDGMCSPTCANFEQMGDGCGAGGICYIDQTSGKPECECDDGWAKSSGALSCDVCAEGYSMDGDGACVSMSCQDVTCDPFEVCEGSTGACVCVSGASVVSDACVCDSGRTADATNNACIAPPQSCAELKQYDASATEDGFYELFVGSDPARPWWAWCAEMAGPSPAEYLPLAMTHDGHNVFERFGEPNGPNLTPEPFNRRLTRTRYEKVRIDPVTLTIDILDTRFASTEVEQDTRDQLMTNVVPVPYGVAQGCGGQLSDPDLRQSAQGRIDLRGTPFSVLNPAWKTAGICAGNSSSMFSAGGVNLVGVGGSETRAGCGAIVPPGYEAYFPSGCDTSITPPAETTMPTTGYFIQLQYFSTGAVTLLPKTCKEAKQLGTCMSDGLCDLFVGRSSTKQWKADCVGMSTPEPATYVRMAQISGTNTNYFPNTAVDAMGNKTHESSHAKVEMDGHTMRININDQRFAATPATLLPQPFAVAYSCSYTANANMSLSLTKDTTQSLTWKSPITPFGECAVVSPVSSTGGVELRQNVHGDPVKINNDTFNPGCGGLAPEPYARQRGYLACDTLAPPAATVKARPSSELDYLLEMQHVDGNP